VYTTDVIVDAAEFVTAKGDATANTSTPKADDFINQGIDADKLNDELPF